MIGLAHQPDWDRLDPCLQSTLVKATESKINSMYFLMKHKVLSNKHRCTKCFMWMKLVVSRTGGYPDLFCWKCVDGCRDKRNSIRKGSILYKQGISLSNFIWLLFCFAYGFTGVRSSRYLNLDKATACKWFR